MSFTHISPSGDEGKQEIECFYNVYVPYISLATQIDLILAGDFNCVLLHSDATGKRIYSRALDNLVTGLVLYDVGGMKSTRLTFTHFTPTGASRLDRIYISPTLQRKKERAETVVAAFTEHHAVVMRMETSDPMPAWGKGLWRMNNNL